MIAAPVNPLNIVEHDARPKSETKGSEKEIRAIVHDFIRKIAKPNRSQIVEELRKLGFSDLEANQGVRHLEDNHEIFLIEDSGVLKVLLYRNISEFERQQKLLQNAWIRAKEQKEA